VVVVGATNYPDHVDIAIRRPSRLGRHVRIKLPEDKDRIAILEHHTEIKLSGEVQAQFVRATRGLTGDHIGQIARDAKRLARRNNRILSEKDILAKLPEMREIPLTHLHQAAIHEIGHAIIAVLLDGATITAVEIDAKAISGLDRQMIGTAMIELRPGRRQDRAYYVDKIAVLLAGVAAEELVLGAYSDSGAGDDGADLIRATNLATAVEGCLGMGETLVAEMWTDSRSLENIRMRDPSLRERADVVLRTQFDRAKRLLSNNLSLLNRLTDELLEARRLEGPYVDELVRTFGDVTSISSAEVASTHKPGGMSAGNGGEIGLGP
jgi:ATP-dependent Zn protease